MQTYEVLFFIYIKCVRLNRKPDEVCREQKESMEIMQEKKKNVAKYKRKLM
jgi:hypothetical protein